MFRTRCINRIPDELRGEEDVRCTKMHLRRDEGDVSLNTSRIIIFNLIGSITKKSFVAVMKTLSLIFAAGSILIMLFGINGCSDTPYTSSMLQPGDVDKYIFSPGDGRICITNGFETACLTLVPKPNDRNLPIIHFYPSSVVYVFYHEGVLVVRAERPMDTTNIVKEITGGTGTQPGGDSGQGGGVGLRDGGRVQQPGGQQSGDGGQQLGDLTPGDGGQQSGGQTPRGTDQQTPGDTGGDNTGGDNTGDDNTGGDNTDSDNTGGDNTGGDSTGGDNTGGDNTGGDNTDGDNTGGTPPNIGGTPPNIGGTPPNIGGTPPNIGGTPPLNNPNPSGHNPPDNVQSHYVYNTEDERGDGWIVWVYYPHNYVEQGHPRRSINHPDGCGFTLSITGGERDNFAQTSGACTDDDNDNRDDRNDMPCSASGSDYSAQFFVVSSATQITLSITWTHGVYAPQTQTFNIMKEVNMRDWDAVPPPDPGHTDQDGWR